MNSKKNIFFLIIILNIALDTTILNSEYYFKIKIIIISIIILIQLFAYFFCKQIILKIFNAKEIKREAIPKIFFMTTKLANKANIITPSLYIIDSDQPNIFSTGRSKNKAAIAFTISILEILNDEEIEAAIAHEIAHIKNNDTLFMTSIAMLTSLIGLISNLIYSVTQPKNKTIMNPLAMIVTSIFTPIISIIIKICISNTHGFETDRIGAKICGNPLALASTIAKISDMSKTYYNIQAEINPGTAHLFIINPLRGNFLQNLFQHHPKIEERIKKLVEMSKKKY